MRWGKIVYLAQSYWAAENENIQVKLGDGV